MDERERRTKRYSVNRDCDTVKSKDIDPCTLVIFGASGDLTRRKLIPALYQMFLNGSLPEPFTIVGCARSDFDHLSFQERLQQTCEAAGTVDMSRWHEFARFLFYRSIRYDSRESFAELAQYLHELAVERATQGNTLFDLALPPSLYPVVVEMIGGAGLAEEMKNGKGWSRIVIEKPFGSDLQSALALDAVVHNHFQEKQVFRIDHYLAKETVQNILMFRFANAIFEPIWNRGFIDSVGIIAAEQIGVENRAGYYEQAGVIRDMFQNHMLQLLSLIAMEPPSHFEPDKVRDEKVKLFGAIRPFHKEKSGVVLGQYGPGMINGKNVAGYQQEPGVTRGSLIPTFALMPFFVENWRWQGVPFYLVSGKRLARKETRIVVQFKDVPHSMFRNIIGGKIAANRLDFGIYPEEGIRLTFQTKKPGAKVCLRTMTMDFGYDDSAPALGAYEKVLLDCIVGDHLLFWRQDGVEAAWRLLTPLLNECEHCQGREQDLHIYPAGSWGPEASLEHLQKILSVDGLDKAV